MTDRPTPDPTSDKDKVKPFHAKDAASGQEAADAVAAVLKHAAERDQAAKQKPAPKPQPKWMLPLGLNLGVLAAYLFIAPPQWVVINRIAPPPDEQVIDNTRTQVYFASVKIEAYRARTGELPASLSEAGVAGADALDYTPRGDSTYILIAFVGDEDVTFDSARQNAADLVGDLASKIGG